MAPAELSVGRAFFAWTCRGFLNNDGKHKILSTGAVIATLGLLSKSSGLRNSTVERVGGKRIQLALHTGTLRPVMQAYMEAETSVNFTRLFQLFCDVVKKECGYDPRPLVVQVHSDFSDAIEGGRRAVFPGSRPARDYPRMMRNVSATLQGMASGELRGRTVAFLRATRHLPTVELFSACWRLFLQELLGGHHEKAAKYLQKEYVHEVKREIVAKRYRLHEGVLADQLTVLWGDYWSGVLGTQEVQLAHRRWKVFTAMTCRIWQGFVRSLLAMTPCQKVMQAFYNDQWLPYMMPDDSRPPSLWPQAPEPSFLSGTSLHRLGQNFAAEYWARRAKKFCRVEKHDTTFWVMRSQATDKEHPAQAVMQEATARTLVEMLFMSETEAKGALKKAGVYATKDDDSGKERLCLTMLESHFTVRCIVMEGVLPGAYYPKLHAAKTHPCKRLCTCGTFVQRAECPHVYFVGALQRELDLDLLPEKNKLDNLHRCGKKCAKLFGLLPTAPRCCQVYSRLFR